MILVALSFWSAWISGWTQEVGGIEPRISKPEPQRDVITGTVVNSVTGEPVNRAVVQLAGLNRAAMTDASGHFEFHNLAGVRVSITVDKPGFFDERDQAEVLANVEASALVLRMVPAGVIFGKITTANGDPIEGVRIETIQRQILGGRQVWIDRMMSAKTDDSGSFRIAGLPPAIYYVAAEQSQEPTWMPSAIPNGRKQIYAQSYYPGVSQLGIASPIELGAGEEVEANFLLVGEPTYIVAGTLSGPDEISAGVVFKRQAGQDFDFIQSVSVSDGKFKTELPAGSYTIDGYTSQNAHISTVGPSFVISSDTADVPIPLNYPVSIPVIIRTDLDGRDFQQVNDSTAHSMVEVKMHGKSSAPSILNRDAWWAGARSSEISNVEPGTYEVELNTFGQWRVESATCGGIDVLNDDVIVPAGSQPSAIEITLRNDGATVIGTLARETVNNTTVLLVQQRGARNFVRAVTTVAGNFRFDGLAPGEYSLIAFDGFDKLEYMNPKVLDSYLSIAAHISLQPHAIANVTLNVLGPSR
ncbi:MAG TPA: carboxypeptidase-like regulatory domain-containing protein [Terriglobales bacterium]|jgi:hypothetical protein|nr:carboxypeptidase-like regulatory domain-containing protein [Terriglobales bacterium]